MSKDINFSLKDVLRSLTKIVRFLDIKAWVNKKCHFYFLLFNLFCTFAAPILAGSPLWGKARVGDIYIKRRNCTLWFWRSRNLEHSNDQSKTKQRGSPCVAYIHCILSIFRRPMLWKDVRVCWLYIYHRGVFGVARFEWSGNSGAFRTWGEWQKLAPRFFCICTYDLNLSICSPW